jgi:hypothetical protein
MKWMHQLNVSIIDLITDVLARGAREGLFRKGIDPVDVHMAIASLGLFQIANRHTFGYIFGRDFASPSQIERHKAIITEIVLRSVLSNGLIAPRSQAIVGARPTVPQHVVDPSQRAVVRRGNRRPA